MEKVKENDVPGVEELFDVSGTSGPPDITHTIENDWTALHIACYQENLEMSNALLFQGAGLQEKSTGGITPLMITAQRGAEDIAIVLILAGANVNTQDVNGNTALHFAAHKSKLNPSTLQTPLTITRLKITPKS